jgi:hypothetical protein
LLQRQIPPESRPTAASTERQLWRSRFSPFSVLTSIPGSPLPPSADVAEHVVPHGEQQPERQPDRANRHCKGSHEHNEDEPFTLSEEQRRHADEKVANQCAIAGHAHSLPDTA